METPDPFTVNGEPVDPQDFEPIPGGSHIAGLAGIIHTPNGARGYQGAPDRNQLLFVFIVPAVLDKQGKPKQIRKFVALPRNPMHPKANLRLMLEEWAGKTLTDTQIRKFNLRKIVGKRALVITKVKTAQSVRQGETEPRTYAAITAMTVPPQNAPAVSFAGIEIRVAKVQGQSWHVATGVKISESEPSDGARQQQQETQQAEQAAQAGDTQQAAQQNIEEEIPF